MRLRHVLSVDGGGLTAYRCDGRQAAVEAKFTASEIAAFDAYLESRGGAVFALLADVAEESFELECIPHVRGRSGRALMTRKRERHCHGSLLCAALPQGRQSEGRRDDRVLFAALTRPQTLEPWLRSLEQANALLRGVYSLPQVVANLADRRPFDCFLLVTLGRGGMRQTFVATGRLRFSRLTALSGNAGDEAAAACAAETTNMRRYLCGQRLLEHDAPLPVIALVHPDQRDAFQRHCRNTAELRFDILDLTAEAARRGLASLPSDSCSDALFAHMLALKPPRGQFAPETLRRRWRAQQLRRAIDVVGWTAFAASLLFAAAQLPGVLRMRDATAELQAQNDDDERIHRSALQGRTDLPLSPRALRELALAGEQLARTMSGPRPLLTSLSHALDENDAIQVESLEWRIADEFDHVKGPYAVLEAHGVSTDADARGQQPGVERLAERLRSEPAIQTVILKRPSASDSAQALTSADLAKVDRSFALRAVRKL